MDAQKIMKEIEQNIEFTGIQEIYHVNHFRCYRRTKEGHTQEVSLEILDAGLGAGDLRYHCLAKSEDGKTATGNPAKTIHEMLAIVHWYQLD